MKIAKKLGRAAMVDVVRTRQCNMTLYCLAYSLSAYSAPLGEKRIAIRAGRTADASLQRTRMIVFCEDRVC